MMLEFVAGSFLSSQLERDQQMISHGPNGHQIAMGFRFKRLCVNHQTEPVPSKSVVETWFFIWAHVLFHTRLRLTGSLRSFPGNAKIISEVSIIMDCGGHRMALHIDLLVFKVFPQWLDSDIDKHNTTFCYTLHSKGVEAHEFVTSQTFSIL